MKQSKHLVILPAGRKVTLRLLQNIQKSIAPALAGAFTVERTIGNSGHTCSTLTVIGPQDDSRGRDYVYAFLDGRYSV